MLLAKFYCKVSKRNLVCSLIKLTEISFVIAFVIIFYILEAYSVWW